MDIAQVLAPPSVEAAVFGRYRPPFDLTSDLLLACAVCPTAPLRATFPDTPFLSLLGRTPLVIWFGQIAEAWYRDPIGRRRPADEGIPYNELNVMALLRAPALFGPGIYATSALSVRIGHGYGMPKQLVGMDFRVNVARIASAAGDEAAGSLVRGPLLGSGKVPARLLHPLWPRRTWPVHFPSGSRVRAVVHGVRRAQWARIEQGQLSLGVSWLPHAVPLLPVGLYLSGLRLRLPPPERATSAAKRPPSLHR